MPHKGKWKPLFSSQADEWETPDKLFKELDDEFHFVIDVCATEENAKCPAYFTKEIDGLKQSWRPGPCFMNPPYGRQIGTWVRKAYLSACYGITVVCLLPARTDTRWFHDYIYPYAILENDRYKKSFYGVSKVDGLDVRIRMLKGRVKFKIGDREGPAPFPSMIVVYRKPE